MSNKKILIVEDEGIVILHIRKALESLGYIVAGIANSGDEAIIEATEIRPDLVLMDIIRMDDLALLSERKAEQNSINREII